MVSRDVRDVRFAWAKWIIFKELLVKNGMKFEMKQELNVEWE